MLLFVPCFVIQYIFNFILLVFLFYLHGRGSALRWRAINLPEFRCEVPPITDRQTCREMTSRVGQFGRAPRPTKLELLLAKSPISTYRLYYTPKPKQTSAQNKPSNNSIYKQVSPRPSKSQMETLSRVREIDQSLKLPKFILLPLLRISP
jgi:hypothetical protein